MSSLISGTQSAEKPGTLDEGWATLIPADPDRSDPSDGDLDSMVREYGSRDERGKAPVYLGKAAQNGGQPVGRVDALRRKGGAVEAKFTGVDPRINYLHSRGAFHKKSVHLTRSMEGTSLKGVGLLHSQYVRGAMTDDRTPSLDELMQQFAGSKESVFREALMTQPDFSNGYIVVTSDAPAIRAQIAQNAVASLKKSGRWCPRYDRAGLPAVFAETAGTPVFEQMVRFVATLVDTADPAGELLTECARAFAKEHSVSFSEALNVVAIPSLSRDHSSPAHATVSSQQRELEFQEGQAAIDAGVLPKELVELARRRAEADGCTFNYALHTVGCENPGIMQRFQIERRLPHHAG
jgi:hypothetical protein